MTDQMPWGVPKEMMVTSTSYWDGTKDSIRYNVSGAELVGETHTTTYSFTEDKMDINYLP